jgi:glycosyltransferase involved in cell wall biosynthesis
MRVQVVDPPAYTPPYDHALCSALARAGAEVELVTSPFRYGTVPEADGYRRTELFYRRSGRVAKVAEHLPGMLRLRSRAAAADLLHVQWLTYPGADARLLPDVPRVLTVHDPLPAGGRVLASWRAAARRMDALVSHSAAAADLLAERTGVARDRVRVIHHGAFDYLTELRDHRPLPSELADAEGPVILCFGLIRPYKGIDLLIEATRDFDGVEVWVVGRSMMDVGPLRELAVASRAKVRILPRFITDPEIPALFERAEIVALPYREADQSGVLYTALAFGKPIVATGVGGFPEVAAHGALRLVPSGDAAALGTALRELLASESERERLAAAATEAAAGPYSWQAAARATLALYRELLG